MNFQKKADRLDTVLIAATNLCQQLSILQKMQGQENSLLTQYGEILSAQAKEIEESLKSFKDTFSSSINEVAENAFTSFPEQMREKLDQLLEKVVEIKLNPLFEKQSNLMNDAKDIIEKVHKDRYSRFLWMFLGITILVAILVGSIVGVIVVNQTIPNNMLVLTTSQLDSLNLGQKMQVTWPKLTKEEKETILNLFKMKKGRISGEVRHD